ncbi:alpha/beta fold hydrolase [Rahnella sp. BCC 1045]|uniref:alpha/beta hydrolase family protein n=1 Tax=Rahnella sp. BCC 1045 TaxID=2816251 RepID=UPI001C27CE05|nr:alpha/beta fold hydrolase [Rahnella sp. BCC 1045]MBU9818608.1 alpha/beta fold hydrolase [Rahnella sp. BCC 1045]
MILSPDENQLTLHTGMHRPDQRMARKYFFNDIDMDLFFMAAVSWGPSGGLDIGQAFYVAENITDGDADSWVNAFSLYANELNKQADAWKIQGWTRSAGEQRLKAFAAYRSAWQFALPGSKSFIDLYTSHHHAFMLSLRELQFPATPFETPFKGGRLPGVFIKNHHVGAPVVIVIGGADTCLEDLFLSQGRMLWERGYSVAMVDLPGQGMTATQGLHWQTEPEHAIAAVIDSLINNFNVKPGRIALLGISLGGYFVSRAAMSEERLAGVIASSPFPYPYELFQRTVESVNKDGAQPNKISSATQRSRQMLGWKAGVDTPEKMLDLWRNAEASPAFVKVPFLTIVGEGDSHIFITQALNWHKSIASKNKELILLNAKSGADAHCQINGRLRLIQEATGWMDTLFKTSKL